jgi:glycosyltransferase involved in cell wall biosynthesis
VDIRFVICSEKTNLSAEEFKQNPQIIFTSLTPKKIPDALKNANILFLPLSWNTPSPEVIEMAVPGKTAEYLASGTPILVHAPADCYLSKYAKERGFAHIVDTEDILALQNGIRKILTDKEYAKNLVVNAQKTSHDYDVRKNALVLKNAMDTI